mmetsp:Transcript_27937/g.77217  ORF Transcript_27937/g.77217 Transcript_27937/m.77217 type:complete len:276 (-) Transcript_27937:80-907(-)
MEARVAWRSASRDFWDAGEDVPICQNHNAPPLVQRNASGGEDENLHDDTGETFHASQQVQGESRIERDQRSKQTPERHGAVLPRSLEEGGVGHVLVQAQRRHDTNLGEQEEDHCERAAKHGNHQTPHLELVYPHLQLRRVVLGSRDPRVKAHKHLQEHGGNDRVVLKAGNAQADAIEVHWANPVVPESLPQEANVQGVAHRHRLLAASVMLAIFSGVGKPPRRERLCEALRRNGGRRAPRNHIDHRYGDGEEDQHRGNWGSSCAHCNASSQQDRE